MDAQYHITRFSHATEPWPNGGWSVYRITGDQIAERIVRENGEVVLRHSWCGYLGIAETLDGVTALIDADMSRRLGAALSRPPEAKTEAA